MLARTLKRCAADSLMKASHPSATESPAGRSYALDMSRGSLIPPEVFTAYAKKHNAARMDAIRERLKLQMNVGNAALKPDGKAPQGRRPITLFGRPR